MAVTKNISKDAQTVSVNYTLDDVCSESTQLALTVISGNEWITAATVAKTSATAGTFNMDVTEFSGEDAGDEADHRSGEVVPSVNGKPCNSNKIIIVQESGYDPPEPPECKNVYVDGANEIRIRKEGGTTCDSAFFYVEGEEEPDVHMEIEGGNKEDWFDTDKTKFYHWYNDPANSTTPDYTNTKMCSIYNVYPCVAESMMRYANITPENKPVECKEDTFTGATALNWFRDNEDYSDVYYAIVDPDSTYGHALGAVQYVIKPNPETESRECTVKWYVGDVSCPRSAQFHIIQNGQGTPEFNAKLTINGLEGTDRATIEWGDGKKKENVANGTYTHEYMSEVPTFECKISAEGYQSQTVAFSQSNPTVSVTLSKGGEPECYGISTITEYDTIQASGSVSTIAIAKFTTTETPIHPFTATTSSDFIVTPTVTVQSPTTPTAFYILSVVRPNMSTEKKNGSVSVKNTGTGEICGSINFTQLPLFVGITANAIQSSGHPSANPIVMFQINSSNIVASDFSVSVDEDFIGENTLMVYMQAENDFLIIADVKANDGAERTATLTLTYNNTDMQITLTQAAGS